MRCHLLFFYYPLFVSSFSKVTPIPSSIIAQYRNSKVGKNPVPGSKFDLSDSQLATNFEELTSIFSSPTVATSLVANSDGKILTFDLEMVERNMIVYEETLQLKAVPTVCRNPQLLAVKPENAIKAGEDAVVMSYVVAYTRDYGILLLAALFIALATKPILFFLH